MRVNFVTLIFVFKKDAIWHPEQLQHLACLFVEYPEQLLPLGEYFPSKAEFSDVLEGNITISLKYSLYHGYYNFVMGELSYI